MTHLPEDDFSMLQAALAGSWSIERELGRGGMGVVYLARDVALDRPVAIKVLHGSLARIPEHRDRFLREARTGARLSHPHIVPIYAVEQREDFVYFVMGLVDGETAGERVRRGGPIEPDDVERILREIGWGLAYAHAVNLVHRDVTLDNILLERSTGRAVLVDFGIASEIDRAGEGPLIGSPAYLAPEVIRGEPPSVQSDLYALGITAWGMLAGRLPFIADDSAGVLVKHLTDDMPSLSRAAPRTPRRMVQAVENALHRDAGARCESVELWLDRLNAGEGMVALSQPLNTWVGRWDAIKPFYALGMTVTAMLSAAAASQSIYDRGNIAATLMKVAATFLPVLGGVVAIHFAIELAMLRRLARLGYTTSDLQLALTRVRQQLRRNGPIKPQMIGRVVHDVGWLAGGLYVLLGVTSLRYLMLMVPAGYNRFEIIRLLAEITQWSYVAFWSAMGFSFLVPSFHNGPDGWFVRIRDAFWSSALAERLMSLASIGLGNSGAPEQTLHRPTELVLDLAIDDLWTALPPTTRNSIPDTRQVVSDLRRRVAQVKEFERILTDSPTPPSPEAAALRTQLAIHHAAGVTALERIRIVLARLGSAAAPAGEFTAQLADARAVEQTLLAELGMHDNLWKQLKRVVRTPSPLATPAG